MLHKKSMRAGSISQPQSPRETLLRADSRNGSFSARVPSRDDSINGEDTDVFPTAPLYSDVSALTWPGGEGTMANLDDKYVINIVDGLSVRILGPIHD